MSFLSDYRQFTSGLEVPPSYHTFCSLVALSALLERKVYTYKGDYIRIYPNLYVVLVGPPGIGKNTAMEETEKILHHFKLPVSAEAVTREKLIMDIQAQESVLSHVPPTDRYRFASPYTIFATELSEFLGAGGIGMISFLTDIYSRNLYEYRTKNKGSVFVNGPYLNVIAGTTPDWITTYLKDDIISGGFSRRCIFVYETARYGSNPLPKITPEMRAAWDRVMARSEAIRKLQGPFKWTDEATKFFVTWYPERLARPDPNLVGYYETKDIQLLKVAMLVALSEGDELVLDRHHLIAGLELLSLVETNLSRVFQGIGRNELNHAAVKVLDQLANAPTETVAGFDEPMHAMPLKRLKAFLFKDIQGFEFDEVMKHLVDTDKVILANKTVAGEARSFVILKGRV
jgi:hypothetical protein